MPPLDSVTAQPALPISEGPPVLLFPSLAGSRLIVKESPVEGFEPGTRVWMNFKKMFATGDGVHVVVEDSAVSSHLVKNKYVEHLLLNSQTDGHDIQSVDGSRIEVRPQPGLTGCEYLTDTTLLKEQTVIMGAITQLLKEHHYSEWKEEKQHGSMIGCSYDWRITPQQMETRDGFFSDIVKQTEQMVAADPEKRPCVVIGFSLGCKIGKYFLHFAHAQKGSDWILRHIAHFVPLGGPFLGSVMLQKAVMVDGAFDPLDKFFSQSNMLTMMRSFPVGRYLQPAGNWEDGLNMPFLYVRDETYCKISIGAFSSANNCREPRLDHCHVHVNYTPSHNSLPHARREAACTNPLRFHRNNEFKESVTHSINGRHIPDKLIESISRDHHLKKLSRRRANTEFIESHLEHHKPSLEAPAEEAHEEPCSENRAETDIPFEIVLVHDGTAVCSSTLYVDIRFEQEEYQTVEFKQHGRTLGSMNLKIQITPSDALLKWNIENHPLAQHAAGGGSYYPAHCRCSKAAISWKAARGVAIQQYEGVFMQQASTWMVPASNEQGPEPVLIDDTCPPPVPKCTAIYGINTPTPRSLFLRHRKVVSKGGRAEVVQSPFEIDLEGEVHGLLVKGGVAFETDKVPQKDPYTGEQVWKSGDGTQTWHNKCCPGFCRDLTNKEYLHVTVNKCVGLSYLGTTISNPYVKVTLTQPDGKVQEFKTAVMGRGDSGLLCWRDKAFAGEDLSPEYNETFEFEIEALMSTAGVHEATLTFEVWDNNSVVTGEEKVGLMGKISYGLTELNINVTPDTCSPRTPLATLIELHATRHTDVLMPAVMPIHESDERGGLGTISCKLLREPAQQRTDRRKHAAKGGSVKSYTGVESGNIPVDVEVYEIPGLCITAL